MTLNAADRKSIRATEKVAERIERERGEVMIALMSSTAGREFVWNKLESAHIFQISFSTEPLQMAFNEGERNQGLKLLNDIIHWCPEQFIQAMREANGRRTDDPSRQRPGSTNGDGRDQGPADADWVPTGTEDDLPGGINDPGQDLR